MILRRLAAALRRQDWFTVFVETMIVVLGGRLKGDSFIIAIGASL